MFNYFKITINTFKESVREPIYFLMLLAGLVLIGSYPSAALFVFSEQLKLVVDSSMATGLIFGLLIAVLSASHTVTREMRNGTVRCCAISRRSRRSTWPPISSGST